RDEVDLPLRCALLLNPERPAPLKQLRPRKAVAPRRRRNLARRLQALPHDLEVLVLGPASPPTRLYHFQPLDLGTVRMTVHKDTSQHRASPGKAVSLGCLLPANPREDSGFVWN